MKPRMNADEIGAIRICSAERGNYNPCLNIPVNLPYIISQNPKGSQLCLIRFIFQTDDRHLGV